MQTSAKSNVAMLFFIHVECKGFFLVSSSLRQVCANRLSSFCVILLTNTQTKERKNNLHCVSNTGNGTSFYCCYIIISHCAKYMLHPTLSYHICLAIKGTACRFLAQFYCSLFNTSDLLYVSSCISNRHRSILSLILPLTPTKQISLKSKALP